MIVHDYPALLRARRRRERWGEKENRLYRRHRWRSEGFHGEAKTWHGLARAVRRGLENMRIQAFLTAAAVNLKRLAAAFLALLLHILAARRRGELFLPSSTLLRYLQRRFAASLLHPRAHGIGSVP